MSFMLFGGWFSYMNMRLNKSYKKLQEFPFLRAPVIFFTCWHHIIGKHCQWVLIAQSWLDLSGHDLSWLDLSWLDLSWLDLSWLDLSWLVSWLWQSCLTRLPFGHPIDTLQTYLRHPPDSFQTPLRHLPDSPKTPVRHPLDNFQTSSRHP